MYLHACSPEHSGSFDFICFNMHHATTRYDSLNMPRCEESLEILEYMYVLAHRSDLCLLICNQDTLHATVDLASHMQKVSTHSDLEKCDFRYDIHDAAHT